MNLSLQYIQFNTRFFFHPRFNKISTLLLIYDVATSLWRFNDLNGAGILCTSNQSRAFHIFGGLTGTRKEMPIKKPEQILKILLFSLIFLNSRKFKKVQTENLLKKSTEKQTKVSPCRIHGSENIPRKGYPPWGSQFGHARAATTRCRSIAIYRWNPS